MVSAEERALPDGDLDVLLRAQADQVGAAMRDAADEALPVVAFYKTLADGGVPSALRNLLTRLWAINRLGIDEEELETE